MPMVETEHHREVLKKSFYYCLFYMVENGWGGGRGVVFDCDSFFSF